MDKECQEKTPHVGVRPQKAPRNSGTGVAVAEVVADVKQSKRPVRLTAKSVFEVDHSRLGIGVFSRPLLDAECKSFRRAWEMEAMPGFEDFQVDQKRVSFLARPDAVPEAWSRIDNLLASATEGVKKAS